MGLTGKQKVTLAVLLAGTLIAVLNMTLIAPAITAIMADMSVGATTVQWVTSGYAMMEAVVIPLNAYLLGRFSTRRLFMAALAWFSLGSLVVSVAPAFGVLLLGRFMQAMSAGVVMPMIFTLILLMFPYERRGSGMGLVTLVIGFAPAIGPVLAGVLVDHVGWRLMFAGVAVLAALVVVFAFFGMESDEQFERMPFDALSIVLMAGGMTSLLYGLSTFTSSDNPMLVGAMIVAGVALLALFARRQLRLEAPMLRVDVLRTRQFRTTVTLIAIMQAAIVGADVVLPIFVQQVLGHDATTTGLVMMPGAVFGAILGMVSGRLFDSVGARRLVVPGSIVALVAAFCLTLLGRDSTVAVTCVTFATLSTSIQFITTPIDTWGMNSLDNSVLQHGNSVYSTFMQVGMSFGTAFIVSLTGLAPLLAPDGTSAADLLALGEHFAFTGMFALVALMTAGVLAFVRDR